MLAQALQHVSLCDPLVTTKSLGDEAGQLRVAVGQPTAGSHTVGLVLELLWSQIVEVLQIAPRNGQNTLETNVLSVGRCSCRPQLDKPQSSL